MPEGFEALAENGWNGYVFAAKAGRQLGIFQNAFTLRAAEWGKQIGAVSRYKRTCLHFFAFSLKTAVILRKGHIQKLMCRLNFPVFAGQCHKLFFSFQHVLCSSLLCEYYPVP